MRAARTAPVVLTAAMALCACGGAFQKSEYFVAYNESAEPNYFRITIEGGASFGEVEYRSGWYDAEAVDRLFGDIAAQRGLDKKAAREQGDAALTALKRYLEALTADTIDETVIAQRRRAYSEALNAITGLAPAGTDRFAASYYADKKLVMMLSNDPTRVVEAIKGRVQGRKLVDALGRQLSADSVRRAHEAMRSASSHVDEGGQLAKALADAHDKLESETTNEGLRAEIVGVLARLEAYTP